MMRSRIHTVAFACAFSIALSMPAAAQNAPRERWVATWGTSLFAAPPRPPADSIDRVPTFFNRTLRQVVRVSAGGSRVRIRLSNENGDRPLVIGSAHIALRQGGGTIDASTDKPLTFNGRSTIVIRPGGSMISDGVSLTVPPLADVAVSLFITDSVRASTRHPSAFQTNYVSPTGDFAGAASFAPDTTFRNWFFLAGVDVVNPRVTGVIVAIGNSITDGTASQADSNSRWPDVLSRRLLASKEPLKAIVNVGIGGNRVVSTGTGPSALQRFDR
ncbi:MAG: SGNH/GDSL hydrolase family protein, partial [Gemmatimonas sp.]